MNTNRRKRAARAVNQIQKQRNIFEEILAQEMEALDDLPELLLESNAAAQMQEYIYALEAATELLSHAIDAMVPLFYEKPL